MTTSAMAKKAGGLPLASWVVLVVLVLAGVAAWIVQLVQGMGVTGLNQQIVWGMYIAGFFVAAGGGAGLVTLVALSEFRPLVAAGERVKLLALALAGFIAAGLLILMDVGAPLRVWRIAAAFKFSEMTLDFWVLIAVGILTLIYLWTAKKGAGGGKLLGILSIVGAVALVVIEGLMLGSMAARPMWGGLTVFGFLVGALVAGTALAVIVLPGGKAFEGASRWLTYGLAISLVLVLAEVVTGLTNGNPRLNEETASLLAGAASPFFWFHVIVGLLVPLYLLWRAAKVQAWVIGALALVGVLADKLWVLVAGQEKPWLDVASGSYFPSWVEFLVVIGIVALGALIYTLALKVLKAEA
jgi:molybdopterin-containing oxidoreductase family membrane subunit